MPARSSAATRRCEIGVDQGERPPRRPAPSRCRSTSWLVLPRWTNAAAGASRSATAAVSRLTSGMARLPARRASATSASMSTDPALHAATIGATALRRDHALGRFGLGERGLERRASPATIARSAKTSTIAALASVRAKIAAVIGRASVTGCAPVRCDTACRAPTRWRGPCRRACRRGRRPRSASLPSRPSRRCRAAGRAAA